MNNEKKRYNLYIPESIIEEVDKYANLYGANRSVMVAFILKTYLDQQKIVQLANLVPSDRIGNNEPNSLKVD